MESIRVDDNLLKHLIRGVKDYAIFAIDPEGTIITWNLGAERIFGYSAQEAISQKCSILHSAESKKAQHLKRELGLARESGSYEEEAWRVRKDGSKFWASIAITALYNDAKEHIGFAKVTRDLTERKSAAELTAHSVKALRHSERAFDSIVAAVKDYAIFMLSPTGEIRSWNAGAQKIKGYTADEVIGQHFSLFYTEKAKSVNHPGFELEEAIKNGSYEEEGWRVKKDGSQFWASVTITAIIENGELVGFVKVTRDLTERKQEEAELEKARDEAIVANQLKSKFVANVTHEIRTPLTGIVGLSQLITGDEKIDQNARELGELIFNSSKQLLIILNDLLDFAKLEAGKVETEKVAFDLLDVVEQVHGLSRSKAEEKGLSYKISLDKNLPKTLTGDATKIRQVLLNLVSNAIKFTEKGAVELSIDKQEDSVVFSVTDTGIGISKEIQEKLFQPFVQANESTTRLFGGTGLGLSISQQFVELMGGEMGLASEPNKGTTIWFSLPMLGATE